jgi:hypothetical protein
MEAEGSLLCSQEPSTSPYPEQTKPVHTTLFHFHKILFNIILRLINDHT